MSLHAVTQSNEDLYRQAIIHIAQHYSANIFIDLGGGDGHESITVAKCLHAKKTYIVDHDPTLLKQIKSKTIIGIQSDLNQKIKLPNNSADFILANQVIEHIAKTDLFVKEIFRLLKPGGTTLICTPNLASWHNIGALVFGWQPFSSQISDEFFLGNPAHPQYRQPINEIQAHPRIFTPKSLIDLLQTHGFTNSHHHGIGYYPLPHKIAQIMAKIDPIHSAYVLITATKPN